MTWYAAHTIVSIRPTKPRKAEIVVYENVILIEANDEHAAAEKARKYGKASIVEDKTLTIDGKPAVESFVGVRKIISISNPWPLDPDSDRPVDGTEITYSKFKLKDQADLSKLVDGKETSIEYLE